METTKTLKNLSSVPWIPDSSVTHCHNEQCKAKFSTFLRRHHCRVCGNIYCSHCSAKQLKVLVEPLLQAKHGKFKQVRVCNTCYVNNKPKSKKKK
eukprot:TRINITY_DN6445_c0_g1_i1.p1 TRINITY_DN6445_c0_g1~~TRINITY_DN6445_c0_g1_i1.p1  ORF type:complete len:95 (-),score=12.34 TRINITY_DN6445_c0_g1_i1:37-321(-)